MSQRHDQPARTPPDRGALLTEQRNPRTTRLDALSIRQCVSLLNEENLSVAPVVSMSADAVSAFIEAIEPRLRAGGRLVYVGAGTSGRLGVLDASECPPTFQSPPEMVVGIIAGGDGALRRSSEGREDERDGAHAELAALGIGASDAVLGIAAGGTTPYVLGALEFACARGAETGLLVCADIERPGYVRHLITARTGPEPLTGSTRMKAGTATKMILNTISTTLMVRLGKCYENLMVDLRATNDKLRDRAARIVSELTGLDRDGAIALLDRAGGSVKSAVVMHRCALDRAGAEAALSRSGGVLRAALETRG